MLVTVDGVDTIDHSDPSGDVENEGMSTDAAQNVDITSLTMETSGDTLIFEMSVEGVINYNGSSDTYFYFIFLDQDGDGSESTTITISMGTAMFIGDYGSGAVFNLPLSGNGTDTLRVELTGTSIDTADHPVQDIYGLAEVSDLVSAWAEDYINEDFDMTPGDDDDEWPNMDEYYAPDKEYENTNDPKDEMPTDTTLLVEIDSFDFSWDEENDREEWEETMDGTASEEVLYGAFAKVFYYKNGSHNDIYWMMGAFNMPRTTLNDATYESHFKGTGQDGKDDWTAWEMYFYGEREIDWSSYGGINDTCVDIDEVETVIIYVRMFSDEELILWNQDSRDITDDYMDPDILNAGDEDDDDDSPGFELALILPMLAIIVGITYYHRRRRG